MTRSVPGLFHGERPTREPGVGPNRLIGRKHCSVKELVPDRQGEAEVDILRPVEPVVDPMIIRADENPFEPPEAQVGVGVREGDDSPVDDEPNYRQGAVGNKDDSWDQGDEVRDVDQRVRTEDRQHIHVLLGVMELMEAPEHSDAVIRKVCKPVHRVHRHEDRRDRKPTWQHADLGQDEPWQGSTDDLRERERQRGDEGDDQRRVENRVDQILTVAAGENRSPLRRS